jgi:hypothetical protein
MRKSYLVVLAIAGLWACTGCFCLGYDHGDGEDSGGIDWSTSWGSSTSGSSGGSSNGGSVGSGSTSGGVGVSNGGDNGGCGCGQNMDAGPSGPDFTSVPVGSPCQSDADCGVNGTCQPPLDLSNGLSPTQWNGGYCTGVGCQTDSECPTDAICFLYPGTNIGLCLASCGTAACQRTGYTCSAVGDPVYACLPECYQDIDCGPSLVCDSGACAPPCASAANCAAGEICSASHCQAGPPQSCVSCGCPTGQTCTDGECVTPCACDADCPIGERCSSTDTCE